MDLGQQAESGKDKRLLVLLAFGVMMLCFDVPALLPDRQQENIAWDWMEDDTRYSLLRVQRAEPGRGYPAGSATRISPRLSLLLGQPLSVNRATVEELALLHGIGPKLAANIVSYRDQHGRISDERALREVPGIGERLAATIGPQLSFD